MATQFTNNSFLMQPGSGDQSASPYGNPLQSYMRLLGRVPGLDENLVANLLMTPPQAQTAQAGMQPSGAGGMMQPDYQSPVARSLASSFSQAAAPSPMMTSPADMAVAGPQALMQPAAVQQPTSALTAAAPTPAAAPQVSNTPRWVENIPDAQYRERLKGIFGGYPSGQGIVNPRLALGLRGRGYSVYGTPSLQNIDEDLALAQQRAKLAEDEKFSETGQRITQSELYQAKVNLAMTRGLDQDLRSGSIDMDQARAIQELYSPRNPVTKLQERQLAYKSALNDFMKAYESGNIELARSMAPGVLNKQNLVNKDQAKIEDIKNTLSNVDWSNLEFSKYIGGSDGGPPPLYSQGSMGNKPIDVQALLGALPKTGP